MLVLGIEGTAHTFGVGIVEDGKILANVKDVYVPKKGGIHPREAADHHVDVCGNVFSKAIESAGIELSDIDLVSFSQGPGLAPCLRTAGVFARSLAYRLNRPLIGVNHCIAHIEIGKLSAKMNDPVILYVSGGNTQVIAFTEGRYRIFGETQDSGIGNVFDQFGRFASLPHPGGPKIEQMAKTGSYIKFPYVVKGMDLSFSGILAEAERKIEAGAKIEDVCFSLQETCFAMLIEVVERAVAHTGKKEVLLTGGVAANKRLQEMLKTMCSERGASFAVVPSEYSGDNGAMIAWTGLLVHKAGVKQMNTGIRNNWRTDEVEINWIK